MGKSRHNMNATGRAETDRFARLPHRLMESAAYRATSPNGRSLLAELVMLNNGSNNGALWLSVDDAAARMGVNSNRAAMNAFDELQAHGFLVCTRDASFRVKAGKGARARCWRLTWLPVTNRAAPSNEWQTFEPAAQTPERKRMERGQRAMKRWRRQVIEGNSPVVDLTTLSGEVAHIAEGAVVDSATAFSKNGGKPPKLFVVDSAPHIELPWGVGASGLSWWTPSKPTAAIFGTSILIAALRQDRLAA